MKGHMYTKKANMGKKGGGMSGMKYNANGGSSSGGSKGGNKYGSVKGGGKSAADKSMHRKGVNY
jgi:hypothetical protein